MCTVGTDFNFLVSSTVGGGMCVKVRRDIKELKGWDVDGMKRKCLLLQNRALFATKVTTVLLFEKHQFSR